MRGTKKKNGNLSSIELKLVSHLFMSVQILLVYFLINEGKFSSKQQPVTKMLSHFDKNGPFLLKAHKMSGMEGGENWSKLSG